MTNFETKFIKDKNLLTTDYCRKLKEHIIKNAKTFFLKENHACHESDFDFFNKTTDREHLVKYDEVFLVDRKDRNGNRCYVICLKNSKDKIKHLEEIVRISELNPVEWRSGYFLLPIL